MSSGTPNFDDLSNDCLALIISLTSPLDACRSSLVSKSFNSAAGSDVLWDKFLPADYQNLVPASPSFSSLKSLYLSLCDHPVLIEDGKKSFSLDKRSGKKCYTLASRNLAIAWGDTPHYWRWISIRDSRFPKVAELLFVCWFEITGRIDSCNLSLMTRNNAFLVFKLVANAEGFENKPIEATLRLGGTQVSKRILYVMDSGDVVVQNGDQYPKVRGDGWFEVALGEFFNGGELEELEIHSFSFDGYSVGGLCVQGIDIKPC
ncbi:hypothetical protein SLA2020_148720 [Shorea laevis]